MNTASPFFSVSHTAAEGLSAMFRAAAWSMDTPAPYSLFHLLLTASGITAAAFLAELFSCKITDCRKVLFPCGLLLAAGELYKQGFLYFIVNQERFDWWYFPFQLCSIPMYLCLAVPLLAACSPKHLLPDACTFIQDFGLLGGFMALAEPSGLMHPYWVLTLHGFLWHFFLIFLSLYCSQSGLGRRDLSGFLSTLPLFAACCLIATVINVLSRPYGNADMFYISPYYPNLQIVFHRISLTIGITFGNICYLLSVITGGAICHWLSGKISSAGRPSNTARLQ